MAILFALLCLAIGAALVLVGYRLARFIIPLWGFLAGLSLGGAVISAMSSTPFLASFLGIVVGLAAGLIFAVLAYLYYAVAVVILIGAFGYWIGSGFILFLGFNPGLLSTVVGLAAGIIVGFAALLLNAPKYVLIVVTSAAGAVAMIGGALLLFNQIPLEAFSYAAVHATIDNSFSWSLIAFAIAVLGVVTQSLAAKDYEVDQWGMGGPTDHLPRTPSASHL